MKTNDFLANRINVLSFFIEFRFKMSRKEALSQFINQIHGRPVVVKLNSGVDYRGMFKNFDFMWNIFASHSIRKSHSLLTQIFNVLTIWIMEKILINRIFFVVVMFLIDYRCFSLFGWLHEYRIGSNGRICKRSIEK